MKPWMISLLGLLLLLKLYQWLGQLQLSLPVLLVTGAALALASNWLPTQPEVNLGPHPKTHLEPTGGVTTIAEPATGATAATAANSPPTSPDAS